MLKILSSFLSGRTMVVKAGGSKSAPRTVEGGVAQGALLGMYLFNATIDTFEAFASGVGEP